LRYILLRTTKTRLQLKLLSEEYPIGSRNERSLALQDIKRRMLIMPREMREEAMAEIRCEADVEDMTPLDNTMLNWHEVKEMHRMGMSFGAHTLSHPSLPHIPLEEAKREILESKQTLEAQLDQPITHFSYPNPGNQLNFNEELKAILQGGGYNSATTSEPGYVKPGDDFFRLKRKGIYTTFSDLPDFHCWIEKENIINRWNHFPILGSLGFKLLSRSE